MQKNCFKEFAFEFTDDLQYMLCELKLTFEVNFWVYRDIHVMWKVTKIPKFLSSHSVKGEAPKSYFAVWENYHAMISSFFFLRSYYTLISLAYFKSNNIW